MRVIKDATSEPLKPVRSLVGVQQLNLDTLCLCSECGQSEHKETGDEGVVGVRHLRSHEQTFLSSGRVDGGHPRLNA